MQYIRNFCIIAHIDHGKSTLADRLLEFTGAVNKRDMQAQVLDDMDLEKERGITIKSHAIQMDYTYKGEKYVLNLIDTPGHVDFSYEVSRSIAACEGALLIVDAAQGIQAQTISNLYLALEHDLTIIPILNKMDLPSAEPEMVTDQIVDLIGCDPSEVIPASGKTGMGIEEILAAIIERIKPPVGDPNAPLQALIFDSVFNSFRGIIAYFKIINGTVKKGEKVKFVNTGAFYNADEVGVLKLKPEPRAQLSTGDVGYIISGIKSAKEVKVGDTITHFDRPCESGIHGFEEVKPMVFAGIYPVDTEDFEELRYSMEKLQLNDASLTWEPESSLALGFGFRCGFLGMLHMEIVQERLEREFNMTVITTVPNVSYIAYQTNGIEVTVNNPSDLPDPGRIDRIEEPYIKANIITKSDFIGPVMSLCIEKRGQIVNQNYLTADRVELVFEMPLGEVVFDFFDRLKSISKGYASFDYHPIGMRDSDLVKLDILLKGEPVDALSCLIHRTNAYLFGKKICEKLKELIPKQQFEIPIQAAIGAKIISRETISAIRKDVTAKCYGGDISRKRKLLEKQKEGKKRMKQVGNAFMAVLKLND
jgi:GTP-binding protein LepA